jgi:hypothetical protein
LYTIRIMAIEAPAFLNVSELAATLTDPAFAVGVIGVGMFAAEGQRAAIAVYRGENGSTSRPIMSFETHNTPPIHDGVEHNLIYPSPNTGFRKDALLVAHTHSDGPIGNQLPTTNDLAEFLWQNKEHPGLTKGIIMPHRTVGIVTLTLFRAREDRDFQVDGRHLFGLGENARPEDTLDVMGRAGIISMSASAEVTDSTLLDAPEMARTFYR